MTSPGDKIARKLAPTLRKVQDHNIDVVGTATQLLRITENEADDFGFAEVTYNSEVMHNCYISYPINEIEIFESRQNQESGVKSISMMEILPIRLKVKFEGDFEEDPIEIQSGDMLVDVLEDDKGNKLPIIMQIEKLLGGFRVKYLVQKTYELSLFKGTLNDGIQQKIDTYIAEI